MGGCALGRLGWGGILGGICRGGFNGRVRGRGGGGGGIRGGHGRRGWGREDGLDFYAILLEYVSLFLEVGEGEETVC